MPDTISIVYLDGHTRRVFFDTNHNSRPLYVSDLKQWLKNNNQFDDKLHQLRLESDPQYGLDYVRDGDVLNYGKYTYVIKPIEPIYEQYIQIQPKTQWDINSELINAMGQQLKDMTKEMVTLKTIANQNNELRVEMSAMKTSKDLLNKEIMGLKNQMKEMMTLKATNETIIRENIKLKDDLSALKTSKKLSDKCVTDLTQEIVSLKTTVAKNNNELNVELVSMKTINNSFECNVNELRQQLTDTNEEMVTLKTTEEAIGEQICELWGQLMASIKLSDKRLNAEIMSLKPLKSSYNRIEIEVNLMKQLFISSINRSENSMNNTSDQTTDMIKPFIDMMSEMINQTKDTNNLLNEMNGRKDMAMASLQDMQKMVSNVDESECGESIVSIGGQSPVD